MESCGFRKHGVLWRRLKGAHDVLQVEDFGRKLAHQFPWVPAAYVAVGLALRRRFLSDPEAPSTIARRRQITKACMPLCLGK